jgi:Immunoglobulin I-set domain.
MLPFIAGQNAVFDCTLTSDTPTSMTWLKDNKPLEDRLADRVLMSSHEDNTRFLLEVQHCRESDTGVYTARATNVVGSATCTAQLVVQECKYGNVSLSLIVAVMLVSFTF